MCPNEYIYFYNNFNSIIFFIFCSNNLFIKPIKSLSISDVNNNIFKLQLNEISKDLKMGVIKQKNLIYFLIGI